MRAVAVPYIIALILGVAVIGLVGYWFASSGGKFGGQSAKTICDNKFLQWCITTGGSLATFLTSNQECNNLGSYQTCDHILGKSAGSTSSSGGESGGTSGGSDRALNRGDKCSNNDGQGGRPANCPASELGTCTQGRCSINYRKQCTC